jgi:Na+-driven multidrug efflux pump
MINAYRITRLILRLAALTTFVIGGITLVAPDEIVRIFDGSGTESNHMVRFIGTALIGFAVMNWLYSSYSRLDSVLPAIYGNLTSLWLAITVDIIGLFTGSLSKPGWFILFLHVIFAAAFSYCVILIKRIPEQE